MQAPGFAGLVAGREFISTYLPKTPLVRSHKISEALGCDYYLKLDNLQPVGAFKVRGGVNLVARAPHDGANGPMLTAPTVNNGKSIAYAERLFNTRVIIDAPAE